MVSSINSITEAATTAAKGEKLAQASSGEAAVETEYTDDEMGGAIDSDGADRESAWDEEGIFLDAAPAGRHEGNVKPACESNINQL